MFGKDSFSKVHKMQDILYNVVERIM